MVVQNGAHSKPQTKSRPIYHNGRVIGEVTDRVFRKTVSGSQHILRTPPAICFDRSTLVNAEADGAILVHVCDRETGTSYLSTIENVWTHCFPVQRGYGDQVGLLLDRWSINGAQPKAEARAAETNQEIAALQMSLFALEGAD